MREPSDGVVRIKIRGIDADAGRLLVSPSDNLGIIFSIPLEDIRLYGGDLPSHQKWNHTPCNSAQDGMTGISP